MYTLNGWWFLSSGGAYPPVFMVGVSNKTMGKISSPVMYDITVRIVLVLMLMGNMVTHLVDVNGAFLLGKFKLDEKIFMKIPCGFEKIYPQGGLLFLK